MDPDLSATGDARLFGVLVTYRQPAALPVTLRRIAEQSQPLAGLVVVDNDPSPATRAVVEAHAAGLGWLEYVASPENLGPAGGLAVGMERVLDHARPQDWIVLLDDGDPPQWSTMLGELLAFGQAMRATDRRTAGVGLIGARFDWASGRLVRPADRELDGPVAIDYIGGGQLPLYLTEAVRRVGPFSAPLFFGCDDLEYGLRLRQAGYSLYAPGALWLQLRRKWGHTGLVVRPGVALGEPTWRRYYSLRNMIHILRTFGGTTAAIRVTALQGLLKPLANMATSPGRAWRHLRLNLRACRDGWTGRLGRTLDPEARAVELRSQAPPSA
jgi:glycosyltransferase involved in cell wall biosynthesis